MTATWFSAPAPVARRVRAFFAPVNRGAQAPVLFDPSEQGRFSLDAPPAPWISLGWVQDFVRKTTSKSALLMTGIPAAPLEQVRETLEAQVSLQFLSWTKLTMGLATGAQHMNILAPAIGAASSADGAQASPAVTPQSGSTSTSIRAGAYGRGEIHTRRDRRCRCGLRRADRLCGHAGGRRVRAPGANGRGLRATRNVQCRAGRTSDCNRADSGLAVAGRCPCTGRQGTGRDRICRSRRRKLLPGVVGTLCAGRQPGRTNLLLLSTTASYDRCGGDRIYRSIKRIRADIRVSYSRHSF